MEAQIARQEVASGMLAPSQAMWRLHHFSAEVEKLAREGEHHLHGIGNNLERSAGCALPTAWPC
jgi:hypothetical protein